MRAVIDILSNVDLPDSRGLSLDSRGWSDSHIPLVFVGLAILALALVGYLLWDFLRQKRLERRERQFLVQFREQQLKRGPPPPPARRSQP